MKVMDFLLYKLKRIKMVCDDNQIREGLENITKKQTINITNTVKSKITSFIIYPLFNLNMETLFNCLMLSDY